MATENYKILPCFERVETKVKVSNSVADYCDYKLHTFCRRLLSKAIIRSKTFLDNKMIG